MVGRVDPTLTLGCRNISVVDKVLDRIIKGIQLTTCRTRMPYGKSILCGLQLRQQSAFVCRAKRRISDAGLQVLDRLVYSLHGHRKVARGRVPMRIIHSVGDGRRSDRED